MTFGQTLTNKVTNPIFQSTHVEVNPLLSYSTNTERQLLGNEYYFACRKRMFFLQELK